MSAASRRVIPMIVVTVAAALCTASLPRRAVAEPAAPAVVTPGQRIAALARRELADTTRNHEHRGSDNCTYYNGVEAPLYPTCGYRTGGVEWRGGTDPDDDTYAWCANFAKYVWSRSGVVADVDDLDTWAVSFEAYGRDHHTWHPRTSPYRPRPGDALVMDRRRDGVVDHVGIVTAVSGSTVTMISGNSTGDRTTTSVYRDYRHDRRIVGFTTPAHRGSPPRAAAPDRDRA